MTPVRASTAAGRWVGASRASDTAVLMCMSAGRGSGMLTDGEWCSRNMRKVPGTSRTEHPCRGTKLARTPPRSGGNVSSLKVEMVAADRKVWEGEAKFVRARSISGELGILPGHAPLLGVLVEGEVAIESLDGVRSTVMVDGGFLSVDSDVVTIVAEHVDASSLQTTSN